MPDLAEARAGLLVPYPAEEMQAWRVGDDAKSSRIEPRGDGGGGDRVISANLARRLDRFGHGAQPGQNLVPDCINLSAV